jgi:predicted nuclease of restriction endonuclease-like RecB superfamily
MRFTISDFEFDIRGSGSNAIFVPFYLKYEDGNRIQIFIDLLEGNLHKKRSDTPLETLSGLFISEKISKSLLTSMNRYYQFQTQSIEKIIGIEKKSDVNLKGDSVDIASFLKQAADVNTSICNLSGAEIRSLVFEIVNRNKNGYVKSSERDEIIKKIEEDLKIPKKTLANLLYYDIASERALIKKDNAEPSKIIGWYNYDVIETTLAFALDFQIKTNKLPGYIAKNVVYISKKNYVFTEIALEGDGYVLKIIPPLEMFRDKGGWSRNISNVAMYIIQKLLKEKIDFQFKAIIMPRKRKAFYSLNSKSLPILPSFREKEDHSVRPEIDSKIEDRFLKTWKNYHGWKAKPEPDAIIIGKKMYIPDFLLERGGKSIYVEIVGFYTAKYIQKKKSQMKELASLNLSILYLVDQSILSNFTDLRDVTLLPYTGTTIPSNELTEILETNFSDFDERFPEFKRIMEEICSNLKQNNSLVTLLQIQERLQSYSTKETNKILSEMEIKHIIQEKSIIFIPSFGMVSQGIVTEVEVYLKKVKRISLESLKEKFPEYKEALIAISQYIGCKIHWKSIEVVEIIAPRN